jgi:hypothetical protein
MASLEDALQQLRRTLVGYSQSELGGFLEAGGYEFQREARHGRIYRHPRLASEHPDVAVRKRHAYVVVQKGTDLKAGAARDVRDALEVVAAWESNR